MYGHKVNFYAYFTFLILLCHYNFFFAILSTGSSFLPIMITHNVDFCKNKLRFMPNYFPFESNTIVADENEAKQFLFHL